MDEYEQDDNWNPEDCQDVEMRGRPAFCDGPYQKIGAGCYRRMPCLSDESED